MRTYRQYCPIARTSELISERWTPIIIRNLLAGCRTFSELLDGAPGISKALLAQRLELLERHGILMTRKKDTGRGRRYELTDKGRELKTITDAMGAWGARWLELQPAHVDPAYVLWATSRLVDLDKVPSRGLVVRVDLDDMPGKPYWLVLSRESAETCSAYPGRAEDLIMRTDSETLARWHLRHISFEEGVDAGRIRVEGPRPSEKALVGCIRPSPFAGVERVVAATGSQGTARP